MIRKRQTHEMSMNQKVCDLVEGKYSILYAKPVTANTLAITAAVPEFPPISDLDANITIEEVKSAIKALKNNKSPGADGLLPEVFKAAQENCSIYPDCGKTKVRHVLVRELLYADDAAFAAHSEAELQLLCASFDSACQEFGLQISLKKTVVLAQPATLCPAVSISNTSLSVVDKFTYLRSTVSNTNNLDVELDMRIGKASSMFGKLSKRVWHNKNLSSVCTTRVLSTLLYASESWTTYRRHEHRLNAFHFRCLHSILGVCWNDHVPNSFILEKTGSSDLYTIIRQRHLRWAGHIQRMDDARLPKLLLYGELANAPRKQGRPRLRFKDVIKRDLKYFSINLDS
ncbi:putative uncharacterized transposon-derived protein F52C9.6 [Merluccius polli]|uniref:Uncharacterized transposon-derived protein F52C9.6 n=1 Tax=Merluccius polli TaxID=89951 RepID=A0AA47M4U5_MERPO|nr:putative uncharacterized transposon-derived protein F52C9.6 [Merluccius polli]